MPGTKPSTLLLVRHAETADNVLARLSGWTDGHLSSRGEHQVRLLASHFRQAHRDVAAIYASPLVRARQTAEAIARLTGHQLIFDDDLREMHFGAVEGLSLEDIRAEHAELLAADEDVANDGFVWPSGESRSGFTDRVRRAVNRIAEAHPGESVGLVTHGGVISVFLALLHGQSAGRWREWLVSNASLTEVSWDPHSRRGKLVKRGDDGHLRELGVKQDRSRDSADQPP